MTHPYKLGASAALIKLGFAPGIMGKAPGLASKAPGLLAGPPKGVGNPMDELKQLGGSINDKLINAGSAGLDNAMQGALRHGQGTGGGRNVWKQNI